MIDVITHITKNNYQQDQREICENDSDWPANDNSLYVTAL